jgi:hypothetical protein
VQPTDKAEKDNNSNAFRLSVAPMMDCLALLKKSKQGNRLRPPAFAVVPT